MTKLIKSQEEERRCKCSIMTRERPVLFRTYVNNLGREQVGR